VSIPGEPQSFSATELAAHAHAAGIENAAAAGDVEQALQAIAESKEPGRVLICGSLYLAGEVLKQNAEDRNQGSEKLPFYRRKI
jgi:dihydrofolate synthase/folylpolyglutamate synthase